MSGDTKDVVRLGTGLIGTIAALVLGLIIASANSTYETQSSQVKQLTANIILLDLTLAQYGPETESVRNLLRRSGKPDRGREASAAAANHLSMRRRSFARFANEICIFRIVGFNF
jgi:hypothetical protein